MMWCVSCNVHENAVTDIGRPYPGKGVGRGISLATLLSEVEEWHGCEVGVFGYLQAGPEELALYLSRDHARHHSVQDSVWVEFAEDVVLEGDGGRVGNKYVQVLGMVDTNVHGHLGAWEAGVLVKKVRVR